MLVQEQDQVEGAALMLDRAERIRLLEIAAESGAPADMLTEIAQEYEQYVLTGKTAPAVSTSWSDSVSHHDKGN